MITYECYFYLSIALLLSIPTSIYTKIYTICSSNIMAKVLINFIILQCAQHFHYKDKNFSSIQLQLNTNFSHQSSFYLCNFVHQSPGESPRLKLLIVWFKINYTPIVVEFQL